MTVPSRDHVCKHLHSRAKGIDTGTNSYFASASTPVGQFHYIFKRRVKGDLFKTLGYYRLFD